MIQLLLLLTLFPLILSIENSESLNLFTKIDQTAEYGNRLDFYKSVDQKFVFNDCGMLLNRDQFFEFLTINKGKMDRKLESVEKTHTGFKIKVQEFGNNTVVYNTFRDKSKALIVMSGVMLCSI
ncbi:unnamed protein product [Caenorhabditis angaria]|uniref:Uncharacterized protein n=1 Tax=Caenorhabditis angaria TaxID=860376 RepID=A0A9P1I947_9PELO|nr:unnamed protein product [Caenorhabditis angaria]